MVREWEEDPNLLQTIVVVVSTLLGAVKEVMDVTYELCFFGILCFYSSGSEPVVRSTLVSLVFNIFALW